LQRVRRAVRLECPNLHLTETLATELGFTTQRLLRHERVRSGRARVHLVIHQVVQLKIVHVTYGDGALKLLACSTIIEPSLRPRLGQPHPLGNLVGIRHLKHLCDFSFCCAVKHRRSKRHTIFQVLSELNDFIVSKFVNTRACARAVVHLVKIGANLLDFDFLLVTQHITDTLSQALCSPT